MQAAQNTSQVFLGVNLKCTSCHDSFVNKWKLKDAYGLAAYFSPEPTLQMYPLRRRRRTSTPARGFLFPEPRARAAIAARSPIAAPPPPRSSPIRAWAACRARSSTASGSACSAAASSPTVDEMDGEPWSPALLDWLASDFVEHGYDIKHLIATIVTSRAYQMPAVPRDGRAAGARLRVRAARRCGA